MRTTFRAETTTALTEWFQKKRWWCTVKTDRGAVLIVHGTSSGKLTIPDKVLNRILPDVQFVMCCHPAMVSENYQQLVSKLLFPRCTAKVHLQLRVGQPLQWLVASAECID